MTIVEIRKKHYSVPQKWNELTFQQLVKAVPILFSKKPIDTTRLLLFKAITGCPWWVFWWTDLGDLADKLYLVDWMLEENDLTTNLLPVYKRRYGPADSLNNLVISEFVFTEQHFQVYQSREAKPADRTAALNKLVAILYRPGKRFYNAAKNKDGDIRQPFNDNLTAYYEKQIAAWPFEIKQCVAFWYAGCRNELVKEFPRVFGGSGGGEESVYGLWDVLYNIAEKQVMGNLAAVEKEYLKSVLMVITKTMADAERLEKMYKKK